MKPISAQISQINQRIEDSCQQAGRAIGSVQLLAVSKTKPVTDIEAAIAAGQVRFGENYVQEAIEKIAYFRERHMEDLEWHFIGPLQSNKTKLVAEYFDWVQSVDRFKLAQRLSDQRAAHDDPLQICVQVNISGEAAKSGCLPSEVLPLCQQLSQLPHLTLRGLMAIPEHTDDIRALQQQYQQLHQLFLQVQQQFPQVDTLSAGMSQDMELAISNGSHMVRIGTAIFGRREPKS